MFQDLGGINRIAFPLPPHTVDLDTVKVLLFTN
jgi:hypothetical protein